MKKIYLLPLLLIIAFSCKKQDQWLDKKSNIADVVPGSIPDFQALLDNVNYMNSIYPMLGALASDNYFVTSSAWQTAGTATARNAYIWAKEVYEGGSIQDWNQPYALTENANIVLDGIKNIKVESSEQLAYNNVHGSALFFRAMAFYNLAQVFCKPYRASDASSALGIPLRMTSDINEPSVRGTVQQTYDQIIKDLQEAMPLLPVTPIVKTRPSKASAAALLAKVYLVMGNYAEAYTYANSCLNMISDLLDFSTIDASRTLPFPNFRAGNKEIIFYATGNTYSLTGTTVAQVDATLYSSYEDNDLRKVLFYRDPGAGGTTKNFRGNYTATAVRFSGIATNEIILVRAESSARLGNTTLAMNDLNTLLKTRWKKNTNGTTTYIDKVAASSEQALTIILTERAKELPFTGMLRWEDLRRLNMEPSRAITLTRTINGQTYTLAPNDNRYVFAIPDDEIKRSGIEQNER